MSYDAKVSRRDGALLSKRQLAAELNIATRTLDDWMRCGRIPYLKIGKTVRFRLEDVLGKLSLHRIN